MTAMAKDYASRFRLRAMPHATEDLSRAVKVLRQRGIAILAMLGWAVLAIITLVAVVVQGSAWSVLAIGAAANIGPSLMALRKRHDAEARAMVGTLAAIMPALLVYALRGHGWQMDSHMYFFVALAALTVLCDWRPIAIASILIAAHHLVLEWAAPAWVFAGEGNLGRVLFHAIAVILQFAVLSYVTARLAGLLAAQDAAVVTSGRLAAEAQEERARVQEALAIAKEAEAVAERARRQSRDIERRHAEERRDELLMLAGDFERSVAGIAIAIEKATGQLEASSIELDDLSGAAGREAGDVAANTEEATEEIRRVADAIAALGTSIGAIAAAAQQQRTLTALGRERGERSSITIAALATYAEQIGGFIDEIRGIAAKTNLLALNATIEASRAGDAGRGFAVVAGEVKGLAAETARASDRITDILNHVRTTAEASVADARTVEESIVEVSHAASEIAAGAEDQRILATDIGASATRASESAERIEGRIGALAGRVAATVALSAQVRSNTSMLMVNARDLRASSERFVRHLRDEDNIIPIAPRDAA